MNEAEQLSKALVCVLKSVKKPWNVCCILCDYVAANDGDLLLSPEVFSGTIAEITSCCFKDSTSDFCSALEAHLLNNSLSASIGKSCLYAGVIDEITLCLNGMSEKDMNDIKLEILFDHAIFFGDMLMSTSDAGKTKQLLRNLGEKCSKELHERLATKLRDSPEMYDRDTYDAFAEGGIKKEGPGKVLEVYRSVIACHEHGASDIVNVEQIMIKDMLKTLNTDDQVSINRCKKTFGCLVNFYGGDPVEALKVIKGVRPDLEGDFANYCEEWIKGKSKE